MKYYREGSINDSGQTNYFCKICEEEERIGIVMLESEIKMIRHIQSEHPEKNLVVEAAGNEVKLISEKIETGHDVNQNYSKKTFSQDDVFYPCDSCDAIFLSLEEKKNHSLSHDAQLKVKQKKVSNINVRIQNERCKSRIVPEFKCSICSKSYHVRTILRHHVVSHFYSKFYPHLPCSRPFKCPLCSYSTRDRISLARHYAIGHQKIYEHTQLTPADLYYS